MEEGLEAREQSPNPETRIPGPPLLVLWFCCSAETRSPPQTGSFGEAGELMVTEEDWSFCSLNDCPVKMEHL